MSKPSKGTSRKATTRDAASKVRGTREVALRAGAPGPVKKTPTKKTPTKKTVTGGASSTRQSTSKRGPKTVATEARVDKFFDGLDAATQQDCRQLDRWMSAATGTSGVMYGTSIVGYGNSTIRYADGREAPWMKLGFSPRKQAIVLYGVLATATPALLAKLGKHDTGKGCLYIKRLAAVDAAALENIIVAAARN